MAKKVTINQKKRSENLTGWLFVSPLLLGLSLFLFFPLVMAIVVSFTDYKMYGGSSFFEFNFNFTFDNYINAFQDPSFGAALVNATINCIGVPIGIVLAVVFTNLLVKNPKGSMFFRSLFYLPTICGAVIITFIWRYVFNILGDIFDTNLLNADNFRSSMIIMGVWSGVGTSILLLYSSMKGVDKSLYESAQIDGANGFNQLIHITIPQISPVAFYVLLTGISGSLQDFSRFEVMGGGSPSLYKTMPVWEMYNWSSVDGGGNLAYASALGIILGLIIVVISAIQFIASKYWVNKN